MQVRKHLPYLAAADLGIKFGVEPGATRRIGRFVRNQPRGNARDKQLASGHMRKPQREKKKNRCNSSCAVGGFGAFDSRSRSRPAPRPPSPDALSLNLSAVLATAEQRLANTCLALTSCGRRCPRRRRQRFGCGRRSGPPPWREPGVAGTRPARCVSDSRRQRRTTHRSTASCASSRSSRAGRSSGASCRRTSTTGASGTPSSPTSAPSSRAIGTSLS